MRRKIEEAFLDTAIDFITGLRKTLLAAREKNKAARGVRKRKSRARANHGASELG